MRNAELQTGRAGARDPRSPHSNGGGHTHYPPQPQQPLLLFEHVSKWYGSVLALNQVTLELTGGITGLVGAPRARK